MYTEGIATSGSCSTFKDWCTPWFLASFDPQPSLSAQKYIVPPDAPIKLAFILSCVKEDLPARLDRTKERLVALGAKEPSPFEVWSKDPSKIGVAFSVHAMEPHTDAKRQHTAYLVTCIQGASFKNWEHMTAFVRQLPFSCRVLPSEGFPLLRSLYRDRDFPQRKVQGEPMDVSPLTALSLERFGIDKAQYYLEHIVLLVDRFQHPQMQDVPSPREFLELPPAKRQRLHDTVPEWHFFAVYVNDDPLNRPWKSTCLQADCKLQLSTKRGRHRGSFYCPSKEVWGCLDCFNKFDFKHIEVDRTYTTASYKEYEAALPQDRVKTPRKYYVLKKETNQESEAQEDVRIPTDPVSHVQTKEEELLHSIVMHKGDLPALQLLWREVADKVQKELDTHVSFILLDIFDIAMDSAQAYPSALTDLLLGILSTVTSTLADLPKSIPGIDYELFPMFNLLPPMCALSKFDHPLAEDILLRLYRMHRPIYSAPKELLAFVKRVTEEDRQKKEEEERRRLIEEQEREELLKKQEELQEKRAREYQLVQEKKQRLRIQQEEIARLRQLDRQRLERIQMQKEDKEKYQKKDKVVRVSYPESDKPFTLTW
jgi:hypothetical protein